MPLWGWLLVFFGGLVLVGFVADRISKKSRDPNNTHDIQKQVDEARKNQTDYHHFS